MKTSKDIIEENKTHREDVKTAMDVACAILEYKAHIHDIDKNDESNAQILADAINSDDFSEWAKIHYVDNPHHTQYIMQHKDDINLFDLIECCADGCVAYMRRNNATHTKEEEVEYFTNRGFAVEEAVIMANTVMIFQNMIKLNKEQ